MPGRVLVADDDEFVTRFFARVLGTQGYEILSAHDGEEAISVFREEKPELIFLDMLLPRRSGPEVCADIRSTYFGLVTPVIFMTGVYTRQSKLEAMKQHGIIDYLIKPLTVDQILSLTRSQLSEPASSDPSVEPDTYLDEINLAGDDSGLPRHLHAQLSESL